MDIKQCEKFPLFEQVVNNIIRRKYTLEKDRKENAQERPNGKVVFEKFLGKDFYLSGSLVFVLLIPLYLFLAGVFSSNWKENGLQIMYLVGTGGLFVWGVWMMILEASTPITLRLTITDYLEELKLLFSQRVINCEALFTSGSNYHKIICRKSQGERLLKRLKDDVELNAEKIKDIQGVLEVKVEPAYETVQSIKLKVDLFLEKLRKTINLIEKKIKRYKLLVDYNSFVEDVNDNLDKDLQAFFDEIFEELASLPQLEEDVKAVHLKFMKGLKFGDISLDELSDFYVEVEEEFSLTQDFIKA